jgi:hypothetical protein
MLNFRLSIPGSLLALVVFPLVGHAGLNQEQFGLW